MLQIKNISKVYKTGDLVQNALNNVSLTFRDNELVSILGPSGSGKTTLLNIIGGLDSYDTGDLIINSISTKDYKDRDWDTYRNYSVGFVFQSYNLIPHQTVLGNVELALIIGGVNKKEIRKRAVEALTKVGLKEHINKKPNQLSGGQMQRVAIARALVNNPDILLADEPTGALDSETSVQIMELLKEVAKDRLVVMVTHNPELANEYSTRIVKLKDGQIIDDTMPVKDEDITNKVSDLNKIKRAKMSFFTALSLSFKNLTTKKRRTFLTAFAGSIGIIGISLILSLSTGVNKYIDSIQSDTMTSYPIKIDKQTNVIPTGFENKFIEEKEIDNTKIYADLTEIEIKSMMSTTNNLEKFKKYLEDNKDEVNKYLGENGIVYGYNTKYSVFSYDSKNNLVNESADTSKLKEKDDLNFQPPMMAMMNKNTNANFSQIGKGTNGEVINKSVIDSFDVLNGRWPENKNEVMLFVNKDNCIELDVMYQLGYITANEYKEIIKKIENKEEVQKVLDFDEVLKKEFYLAVEALRYVENENGTFKYLDDEHYSLNKEEVNNLIKLKIVGVAKLKEDITQTPVTTNIGYTSLLTEDIINKASNSAVIKKQEENKDVNVLTNMKFEALSDEEKINDTKKYILNLSVSEKANLYVSIMYANNSSNSNSSMAGQNINENMLSNMMDKWVNETPNNEILLGIYDNKISGATYDKNMELFGKVDYNSPDSINIYTDSFENKDKITEIINNYNNSVDEENRIKYTDFVALLTSSMTSIIDVISYVLIGFVSVSLIVSCIMIGIITHISVMERTKEIGVLRALGASKLNISEVFNAETLLIGLCSGIIGIVATLLMNIPITMIIQKLVDNTDIAVTLPVVSGIVLVVLSVIITIIGGLLPAKNAAKKDPVIALRTE